ncbi:MAG: 50S ribosomal protein L1 [uncultured bacterium]|nr:MAG: 50S ribosomal protein L1 [uncultured bacterium]
MTQKQELASQGETLEPQTETAENKPQVKTKKSKFIKKKTRSTIYKTKLMEVEKNKIYSLSDALELLRKMKMAKFDETVELHINTTEAGISGQVKLPHGTGKEIRVAIADDDVLAEVEKNKINFDILIAEPSMMPKLARVAKVLGPRGLMPNPKNGTISDNPEEAMKKFQGGQINFKTESKIPLIHLSIGKTSFEDKELAENIKTIITAVKRDRIRKITLKSTMSPGIRLQA